MNTSEIDSRNGDAAEQMQPATYQRLIENVNNSEVALRELSAWNLEVLVPAHRKINYSASAPYGIASAPQAERLRAQAAWRQAIPPGTLPMAPKKISGVGPGGA